jgi:hypothetical protein
MEDAWFGLSVLLIFVSVFALYFLIMIPFIVAGVGVNRGTRKAHGRRFSQWLPFTGDASGFGAYLHQFLESRGYRYQNYGTDETAYRRGDAVWTGARFIKFTFTNGGILVESFLVAMGYWETGMDGYVGWIFKGELRDTTYALINLIQADEYHRAAAAYGAYGGYYPPPVQEPQAEPTKTDDTDDTPTESRNE